MSRRLTSFANSSSTAELAVVLAKVFVNAALLDLVAELLVEPSLSEVAAPSSAP
jgi:hypothetical protein